MEPEMIPHTWRAVPLTAGERHLSRLVTEHLPGGRVSAHPLSVVSLACGGVAIVTPFDKESHSTLYHDGPLHLFPTWPLRLYEEL